MTSDHTFFGTWVISECSLDGVTETTGLEGIKFRLDESGDIIWYNDLINTTGNVAQTTTASSTERSSSGSGISSGCLDELSRKFINYGQQQATMDTSDLLMQNESAEALFACETFEVIDLTSNGPGLIFGAYAGHSIEFKTNTYLPGETMTLICDGWYQVICKRVRDSQSIGQEAPFSLIEAFHEGYFSDVSIKCMDGMQFNLHSSILRINGFDSSMNYQQTLNVIEQYAGGGSGGSAPPSAALPSSPSLTSDTLSCKADVKLNAPSPRHFRNYEIPRFFPSQISSNYLIPPSVDVFNFSPRTVNTISSSFNCLTSAVGVSFHREFTDHFLDIPKRYPTSCSDSNLTSKEIFNFNTTANSQPTPTITTDFPLSPTNSTGRNKIKPPLSPFRARSPSPFPSSLDTPPSSPLTPISVLQNLPSAILSPIIHWFYAECLPSNLGEDICSKLINFGETTPPLNKMIEPCRKYLKNVKLRKFTIDVIMEIHSCLNKMIQSVNPLTISHSPTVLCDAFKQGIREASVGCAKILQFCNIFVKNATNITRYQRHELIKYIRSRLPIFMSQIHQLLQNILGVLSSLNIDERTDLIIYLVPEIDLSLDIITNLINNIKLSLEKMCKTLKKVNKYDMQQQQQKQHQQQTTTSSNATTGESPKRYPNSDNDLKFVLYMYEVKKMRDIYGRISSALEIIQHKKTTFNDMNLSNKQRTIRRNMEQLIIEMPSYIFRLEEISDSLDDKIGWKEFKFCFKLATSQINGVISKLLDHKPALNDPINQICNLVQRESFTKAMIDLELIDKNVLNQNDCLTTEIMNNDKNNPVDYDNVKLNLVRNFCESPTAAQSCLSKNALRLLHSVQLYDLEFEVIVTTTNPFRYKQQTDINNQNNNDNINDIDNDVDTNHVHVFKAHRVIIAARCEWFKKALLSGMQEDINRKITIYDTSPVIFRRLLLYLYGAPVDKTVGVEQLCELMLLADRYSVDELKEICETTLIGSIDEDSVICLFGIADRFNAINLKTNCLSFISQHTYLTQTDIFLELPILLQNEVQDLIQWCDRIPEPWGIDHNSLTHHYHTHHNYHSNRRTSHDKQTSHQQQGTAAAAATGIFGDNSSSGSGLGLNVNVNVNSGRRGLKSPSRTTSRSRSRRSSPSFM